MSKTKVLVTGAGGFIGHYLTRYLSERGYWVRGVDIKEPEFEPTSADEFKLLDLRKAESCLEATEGIEEVYGLAANMGGIGFIENNKAVIVRDNTLINLQSIEAARTNGVTPGNAGVMRELHVISAVVIGGTSLTGGRATMVGTVVGALIFGTLSNGMNLMNINSNWQLIFTGLILLGASLLDSLSTKKTT